MVLKLLKKRASKFISASEKLRTPSHLSDCQSKKMVNWLFLSFMISSRLQNYSYLNMVASKNLFLVNKLWAGCLLLLFALINDETMMQCLHHCRETGVARNICWCTPWRYDVAAILNNYLSNISKMANYTRISKYLFIENKFLYV